MKWSDLERGDKIRVTKRCLDFYRNTHISGWATSCMNKIFIVEQVLVGIDKIYIQLNDFSSYPINFDGTARGWALLFNENPFEIVELGDK